MKKTFYYLAIAGFLILAPAHADLVSTLTVDGCGGSGCGAGPYGTVDLHAVDANTVKVTVTLAPNEVFAETGAGSPFGFNVDESFSLVPNSLTTMFALAGANTFAGGLGAFTSTIDCPTCNGTSDMLAGPLVFQITNSGGLTPADFIANGNGFYFGADIGVENSDHRVINTGVVGANGIATVQSVVPEPGSVALLLTALGGIGIGLRRRFMA